jgi:hypothetical protein
MAKQAKAFTWGNVTQAIMRLAFEMTKEATRREEEAERAQEAALKAAGQPT